MQGNLRVLIVDDEEIYRREIEEFLKKRSYLVKTASRPSAALQILSAEEFDLVILDINLPEISGVELLKQIKGDYPEMEAIMITGYEDIDTVITAMRYGAFDFFRKPFKLIELQSAIERTRKFVQLNQKLRNSELDNWTLKTMLKEKLDTALIGESPAMKMVIESMRQVAATDNTSVLITGESGTGKELVARGIHYLSSRKDKIFFDVNCSAVPDHLLESEAFGHKKGAFTGALEDKKGWFEYAHQGTLFLDEIGELKPELQTKFLRAIEQKFVRRLGSNADIPFNVRIISASNRNLDQMIVSEKFRKDLFYRLGTFVINVPPLRERRDDIPLLLDFYITRFSAEMKKQVQPLTIEEKLRISRYDFPGNVRELKNMVERAMILSGDGKLHINPDIKAKDNLAYQDEMTNEIQDFDLENNEKRLLERVLLLTSGNKIKAMKMLNITRQSLDRRIEKFDLKHLCSKEN